MISAPQRVASPRLTRYKVTQPWSADQDPTEQHPSRYRLRLSAAAPIRVWPNNACRHQHPIILVRPPRCTCAITSIESKHLRSPLPLNRQPSTVFYGATRNSRPTNQSISLHYAMKQKALIRCYKRGAANHLTLTANCLPPPNSRLSASEATMKSLAVSANAERESWYKLCCQLIHFLKPIARPASRPDRICGPAQYRRAASGPSPRIQRDRGKAPRRRRSVSSRAASRRPDL